MFEPGSGIRNWSKNLETLYQLSVVLYGPPSLTRLAAETLRASDGLTVLGRLFHPGRIGFQPGQSDFHGLQSGDIALRDYDRTLYLSRVLSRCSGLPVFELCPGDDPALEKLVLEKDETFVALPVVPGGRAPVWRALFWYLALPEPQRAAIDAAETQFDRFRRTEEAAGAHFGQKHVATMERKLFGAAARETLVMSGAGGVPDPAWKASLRFVHGSRIEPLLESFDALTETFSGQDWRTLAPSFAGGSARFAASHG